MFRDEYALYRPGKIAREEMENLDFAESDEETSSQGDYWEPKWFQEIDLQEKGESSAEDELDDKPMRERLGSESSITTKESETSQFSLDIQQATVNYRPKKTSRQLRDSNRDSGGSWDLYFHQDSTMSSGVDDFKGALSVVTVADAKEMPQGWQCTDHLREENGERLAMERLSSAHYNHMMALLEQQLRVEGLSLAWMDTILPLVRRISELVKPDVRHDDDDMDIRQYVQFKKVPGGHKTDSCMVNGVVCTKNVAHKKMDTYILNPKILLLTSAIEYQRVENKMSSLDPLVLQEHEFLKNCVAKIANVQPEILLVEKSVARLAQDFLHHAGITVVLNVKPQVMERVSRCTQADLIPSVEQVTKPRLGLCHCFRLQSFKMEDGCTKTLMFFEGCATHLGCSVILRGGSQRELAKVKKVMQFMVYTAYNSRLEMSYLMDEHALPPSVSETDKETVDEMHLDGSSNSPVSAEFDDREFFDMQELTDGKSSKTGSMENLLTDGKASDFDSDSQKTQETEPSETTTEEDSGKLTDPGQISGTVPITEGDSVKLPSSRQENENELNDVLNDGAEERHRFVKALETVHLSCSPFLVYKIPYLMTPQGRTCQVRHFFPKEIYWSEKLEERDEVKIDGPSSKKSIMENGFNKEYGVYHGHKYNPTTVTIDNTHRFVMKRLTQPISEDSTRSLLADFRARGGRMKLHCFDKENVDPTKTCNGHNGVSNTNDGIDEVDASDVHYYQRKMDCMDPYLHQHIKVLFGSYSTKSSISPNPCVYPWVVTMDFYGRNDFTLGAFLERYCFRLSYNCPNSACDVSMIDHVRKFVHCGALIQISLRKLESPIPGYQDSILMWSWCKKCKQVTPVVPMTQDSWSLSFAKYLELRFYGDNYGRRASLEPCPHSLHQDHYQYFGYQNMLASFKFSRITLLEVALPPITIQFKKTFKCWKEYMRDVKRLSVGGHKVYSDILERIMTLKSESSSQARARKLKDFITQQQLDQIHFREMLENVQMSLTTEEFEPYAQNPENQYRTDYPAEMHDAIYNFLSDMFHIKKSVCEVIALWNERLLELIQQERNAKKNKNTKNEDETDGPVTNEPTPSTVTEIQSTACQTADSEPAVIDVAQMEVTEVGESASQTTVPSENVTKAAVHVATVHQKTAGPNGQTLQRSSSWSPQVSSQQIPGTKLQREAPQPSTEHGVSPGTQQAIMTEVPAKTEEVKQPGLSDILEEYDICEAPSEEKKKRFLQGSHKALAKLGHRRVRSLEDKPSFIKQFSAPASSNASSEGPESAITNSDDSSTSKQTDRRSATMKNLIANFLSGPMYTPLVGPFSPDEHYTLPPARIPIPVIDTEPSSIIAYAISCQTYDEKLGEFKQSMKNYFEMTASSASSSASNSPKVKPKSQKPSILKNTATLERSLDQKPSLGRRGSKVLAFLKGSLSNHTAYTYTYSKPKPPANNESNELRGADRVYYKVEDEIDSPLEDSSKEKKAFSDETDFSLFHKEEKSTHHPPNPHIELQFSDHTAKYYCRVYFAEQFRLLRKTVFPYGEEAYIRSLAHCIPWVARGGKSGSTFCKTADDRFILKQMSRLEVQSFTEFAPHYFHYIQTAFEIQRPTALAKILGVYRVGFRNSQTNNTMKQDLLVMENLFYDRKMAQVFDLKGSMRNRHVKVSGEETEDLVLMDENLLKYVVDSPLYIRTHSKTALTMAIYKDSQFLSDHLVMDYSLLVGIDESRKELVVGIIDYIRTFTWDKKLEMVVKSSGILGGQGKMPTVVSPELYRTRFLEAMDKYFLMVPDRWTSLGRDVEC
ncbi:1-phosphatidylinositol 3-phosphate 5-kinase-like [Ptychodera flava]|uniref:1-phosphatidylinositol 3-phosphate 5-kinase-like n=1 Tax=Ptychodera flava TaxID=63121 RepID=UPI003969D04F